MAEDKDKDLKVTETDTKKVAPVNQASSVEPEVTAASEEVSAFSLDEFLHQKGDTTEKGFMYFAKLMGIVWKSISGYGSTTKDTAVFHASWDSGANQLAALRSFILSSSNISLNDAAQPAHFDNASVLAAAVRRIEGTLDTQFKNIVSPIITAYSAFIKSQTGLDVKTNFDATTSANRLTGANWETLYGSGAYGQYFIKAWRYATKTELRIPIAKYSRSSGSWTKASTSGIWDDDGMALLTYGSGLELRLETKGSGTTATTITGYQTRSKTSGVIGNDTAVTGLSQALPVTVFPGNTSAKYRLGTGTNFYGINSVTLTGGDDGDVIYVYAIP